MPQIAITDPADTVRGQRVMVALQRYHHLLIRQLMSLTGYRDRKYVEEIVRQLAKAEYVSNKNFLPKRVSQTGTVTNGAPPSIVSVLAKGRSAKRFDTRLEQGWEHVIALNDVLIAMELFPVMSGTATLLAFQHDLDLHVQMHGAPVIPDGYVAFLWNELKYGFAIELDRGTESYSDPKQSSNWLKKVAGYLSLATGNPPPYRQYFPYEALTVAVVVKSGVGRTRPSPHRMNELVHWTERAIEELGYPPEWGDFFRFTCADAETLSSEEFVLGDHWVIPYTYSEGPLLPSREV